MGSPQKALTDIFCNLVHGAFDNTSKAIESAVKGDWGEAAKHLGNGLAPGAGDTVDAIVKTAQGDTEGAKEAMTKGTLGAVGLNGVGEAAAENEKVSEAVCFTVYGVGKGIKEGNETGDYTNAWGAGLCPMAVKDAVSAVDHAAKGEWEEAAKDAGGFLLDPVIPMGGAKEVTDPIIGKAFDDYEAKKAAEAAEEARKEEERKTAEQKKAEEDTKTEIEKVNTTEAADARRAAATEDDTARRAAYDAARNNGTNRASATAIAGANSSFGNQLGTMNAAKGASNYSQNDYLSKLGYANAMADQAGNLRKGAFLNTMGAIFGGAGEGAQVGSSLGGGK